MTRRFVVISDGLSVDQENAITSFFRERHWHLSHWFRAAWLLAEVPSEWTPKSLHAALNGEIEGSSQVLVFQIEGPIVHWGVGPAKSWEWMRLYWGKPG